MDDELKEIIDAAYHRVLDTSNKTLRNCKLFSIEILQEEDPSYEEIANHLESVSKVIDAVTRLYPGDAEGFRTAVKAREYTQNIINIAGAIRVGDKSLLEDHIDELERRPFT